MSQTAENLLDSLGMAAVGVDHPKAAPRVAKTSYFNRGTLIAVLSLSVLGVGTKLIGDYACERAIDAWTERQRAQLSTVSPEVQAIYAKWEAEQEQLAESDAMTVPTP